LRLDLLVRRLDAAEAKHRHRHQRGNQPGVQRARDGKRAANATPTRPRVRFEELRRLVSADESGRRHERTIDERTACAKRLASRNPGAAVADGKRSDRARFNPRLDFVVRSPQRAREFARREGFGKCR
jgi:hypothetical protein